MNLVHLPAYLIAATLLLSGCAARPGQIALPEEPEVIESGLKETEKPDALPSLPEESAEKAAGLADKEIDTLLKPEIPDDSYFNERGIYNDHGGGSVVFDDTAVLNWILGHTK